jgi:taurine dioxygenase
MDIRPLTGALGAEIFGVDLATPLDDRTVAAIRSALLEYLVIVFRDQRLTPEQHAGFARRFGPLHSFAYTAARALEGHPEVLRVVKEKEDRKVFGELWHADVTFLEKPVLGSILHAIETPKQGGDTLFSNMYLAYETLSDGMKGLLERLSAVHESVVRAENAGTAANGASGGFVTMGAEHPVIRIHPETKRRSLFVNRTYTTRFSGMTVEESRPLLEFLFQHATRPEFITRLRWAPGTVTFWDNRCTQHMPLNDYHGQRREMHRVTIADPGADPTI